MAQKNPSLFLIIFFALIFAAIGGFYLYSKQDAETPVGNEVQSEEIAAEDEVVEEPEVQIDTAAAVSERILGNPSAPIKISEHSSFTCGHCGAFHKNTFKTFKAEYIDTGRAYLVFSDFPLNAPALHASMVARCLPKDQYFDFVQMLFETQDDWAYDNAYLNHLEEKANAAGMSEATFRACLDNKAVQEGVLNRMRAAQAQWQISSTPSFVVNNKTVISGGQSFEEFAKAIEEAAAPSDESSESEEAPTE